MGVINNLIEIRRKFRAIVGANWDGTTLGDIVNERPKLLITTQPVDTSANVVNMAINSTGCRYRVQRKDGDVWRNATSDAQATFPEFQVNLSSITETATCRVILWAYGTNVMLTSDEFTVTRTAAQTASLKAGSKSKGEDIFIESEVDSIDVVEENIEKE